MNKKYSIEFLVQGEIVYLAWYRFGRTHIVRDIRESRKYSLPRAKELKKIMSDLGHSNVKIIKN